MEGTSQTAHFPLLDPPVPIVAQFFVHQTQLDITFDKNIVSQPTAVTNWWVNTESSEPVAPVTAEVVGPTQVRLLFGAEVPGASVIYLASPQDVVGVNGLPVAAFDFPTI